MAKVKWDSPAAKAVATNRGKENVAVYTPPMSPEGTPYLTISMLGEWLRCRYRHDLRYNRSITNRKGRRPIEVGTATHLGIATALKHIAGAPKKTKESVLISASLAEAEKAITTWSADAAKTLGGMDKLTEEEATAFAEVFQSSLSIVARTLRWLDVKRWETVKLPGTQFYMIEQSLVTKLKGWGGYHGTPDWVSIDLSDMSTWIWDWKIRKQFLPPDAEDVSLQGPAYQKLCRENGIQTNGSVMMQVRSSAPSIPTLNKNGSMSRADINSTWEVYCGELRRNGLDVKEYEDMKEKLDRHDFQRMDRVYRADEQVTNIWSRIIRPIAQEMLKDPTVYRTYSHMQCQGCWAREFCQAELRDDDLDFLLRTDFVDLKNPQERITMDPSDFIFHDSDD